MTAYRRYIVCALSEPPGSELYGTVVRFSSAMTILGYRAYMESAHDLMTRHVDDADTPYVYGLVVDREDRMIVATCEERER